MTTTTNNENTFDFEAFTNFVSEDQGWTLITEKDGVVVSTKKVEGSPLAISRGVTVINAKVPEVRAICESVEKRTVWDALIKHCRVVRKITETHQIVYMQSIAQFPVSARDFCVEAKSTEMPSNGSVVIMGISEKQEEIPQQKGFVRGKVLNTGFVLQPIEDGNKTKIIYCIQLNLGGWIPTAIVNKALSEEPLCLRELRKIAEAK